MMLGSSAGSRIGFGRFGHAAHLDARIVIALDPGALARIAARHHQHRDAVAKSLRDRAVGILGAGSVLHHEHAHGVARSDARHRVGHVQAGALLAHQNGPDAGGRAALENVVDRVADDDLDTLPAQDFRNGVGDFHRRFPSLLREA